MHGRGEVDGIPTDPVSGFQSRRSMQARRSLDPNRMSSGFRRTSRDEMLGGYDDHAVGLTDLAEDSDDQDEERGMISNSRRHSAVPKSPGIRR